MTLLNVQVNRGLDGKFRKLEQMVEGFRDIYLEGMSSQLVFFSPVYTGTYVTGHHVQTSQVAATRSSEGKDKVEDPNPYIQEGFEQLLREIQALPEEATRVVFSNDTFHSDVVEYELAHAPYNKTAREHKRIAEDAEAKAKARNR